MRHFWLTSGVRLLCCLAAMGLPVGCAQTRFSGDVSDKPDVNGIRFYLPTTYILIKPDYTKNEANITFWTGPDPSALYAADPYAIAATNTTELQFEKGFITTASNDLDTTKVAAEAIAALDEVAKAALTTAAKSAQLAATKGGAAARKELSPPIYLYMVDRSGKLVKLFGPSLASN